MKVKIGLIISLTFILVGTLFSPGLVQASGALSITSHSAEVDFPARLVFDISARSDADINDVRLHYQVNRTEHARITSEVYIDFTPVKTVSLEWVWDMRKTGGLPPGSSLSYWWTVSDAGGNSAGTTPAELLISDDRFDWRSLTEGEITLFWYEGDESFSGELMTAAQDALARLDETSGAELENPVSIYIYANQEDLLGSMIFPQEWTGGVAFTRYGIIAIGIGTNPADMDWGKRAIAHELTHLVIHQVTLNPYNDLPVWLDEGLAMNAEGELQWYFISQLDNARNSGTLFSVRSLASPFSTDTDDSLLAYAQSYELVRYLIDEYGQEKMLELLNTFQQGAGYDEALNRVYGFDMDGLDALWRAAFEAVAVAL